MNVLVELMVDEHVGMCSLPVESFLQTPSEFCAYKKAEAGRIDGLTTHLRNFEQLHFTGGKCRGRGNGYTWRSG